MTPFEALLRDLDRSWAIALDEPITLRILGSTALILQADYNRGTKDSDVLETHQLTPDVCAALLALCGRGTKIAQRHRMYLEILGPAFPFLPSDAIWHPVAPFTPALSHFRVEVLDVLDVVIAKLARFHGTDRDDITAMAERDLIDPDLFIQRFRSAVERWTLDARADDLPRIVRNFHTVQRDDLFVSETDIELPSWVSDQ